MTRSMTRPRPRPVALTIAGSDSGGGAGIQADLKTFHQFGTFGTSVLTASTAQNTRGVTAVHVHEPTFVRQQMEAVASDLPPAGVKTGMLGTEAVIGAVVEGVETWGPWPLVVDPVMVATSGDRLLDRDAEASYPALLAHATLVTPNVPEAEILTGRQIVTTDDAAAAARDLVALGVEAALVKGGHLTGVAAANEVVDILWDGVEERRWTHPRIDTPHTHGTGCTLSAAVAAGLAHGRPLVEAVEAALTYVAAAIRRAPGLGGGRGPVDHFAPPPGWATELTS